SHGSWFAICRGRIASYNGSSGSVACQLAEGRTQEAYLHRDYVFPPLPPGLNLRIGLDLEFELHYPDSGAAPYTYNVRVLNPLPWDPVHPYNNTAPMVPVSAAPGQGMQRPIARTPWQGPMPSLPGTKVTGAASSASNGAARIVEPLNRVAAPSGAANHQWSNFRRADEQPAQASQSQWTSAPLRATVQPQGTTSGPIWPAQAAVTGVSLPPPRQLNSLPSLPESPKAAKVASAATVKSASAPQPVGGLAPATDGRVAPPLQGNSGASTCEQHARVVATAGASVAAPAAQGALTFRGWWPPASIWPISKAQTVTPQMQSLPGQPPLPKDPPPPPSPLQPPLPACPPPPGTSMRVPKLPGAEASNVTAPTQPAGSASGTQRLPPPPPLPQPSQPLPPPPPLPQSSQTLPPPPPLPQPTQPLPPPPPLPLAPQPQPASVTQSA
ncbi:hypothetical protein Agub_g15705, partial [Astrephomene gubernaculifera]